MRLVLFEGRGSHVLPGLITPRGLVDISSATGMSYSPQITMTGIIDRFEYLRPALLGLEAEGPALEKHQSHGWASASSAPAGGGASARRAEKT